MKPHQMTVQEAVAVWRNEGTQTNTREKTICTWTEFKNL
jgi:hypothetical protein